MAEPRKKRMSEAEEELAGLASESDAFGGEKPRGKKADYEEPEAFGAFEGPQAIGGESFRLELPEKYSGEQSQAEAQPIRQRIAEAWEKPLDYEREEAKEEWHPGLLLQGFPKLGVDKNKTLVLVAFTAIYLVFGGMLLYLFFFNTGLTFEKGTDSTGRPGLELRNSSQHTMHDVWVTAQTEGLAEGAKLAELPEFPPGASAFIALERLPQEKSFTLTASARYHQTVTAKLSLEKLTKETRLRSSFQVPKVAFAGQKFEVKAEICNEAAQPEPLKVTESHDSEAFAESGREYKLQLAGGQCATVDIAFTPEKAGRTTILFNIVSRDNSEQHPVPIEVRA